MPAPERVVTLLSPVFVALSGGIVAWTAKNFPGGPQLDPTMISGVFALGATAAIAAVLKWLHGRSAFTQIEQRAGHDLKVAQAYAANAPVVGAALADVEKVVAAHADQIVAKVSQVVGAPPSVEQVVQAIAGQLAHGSQSPPVVSLPPVPAPVPTPAPAPVAPPVA